MPLVGNAHRAGLGLSGSPVLELLAETALLGAGLWLYLTATTGTGFIGRYGMVIFAVLLVLLNVASDMGGDLTSATSVALIGEISY